MIAALDLYLSWEQYAVWPWLGSSALEDWRDLGREAWAAKWLASSDEAGNPVPGTGYGSSGSTSAMDNGTELDKMLTAAVYDRSAIAKKPKGMSFSTTEGKAWRAAQAGKTIIKEEDLEYIDAALPRAKEAIRVTPPTGEAPCFQASIRGLVAGLQVQTRPDIWYPGCRRFQDLKYVNSEAFAKFDARFVNSRYMIQAGLAYGLGTEAGIREPSVSFLLVESGTLFPQVRDVLIPKWVCEESWRKVRKICEEIAATIESGKMVDAVKFDILDLPGWAEKAIQE